MRGLLVHAIILAPWLNCCKIFIELIDLARIGSDCVEEWLGGTSFGAFAEGHQKNRALAPGVWQEKTDHLVVIKGESGSTEAKSVSAKIKFAAEDTRLDLRTAVAAISVALEYRAQIG